MRAEQLRSAAAYRNAIPAPWYSTTRLEIASKLRRIAHYGECWWEVLHANLKVASSCRVYELCAHG